MHIQCVGIIVDQSMDGVVINFVHLDLIKSKLGKNMNVVKTWTTNYQITLWRLNGSIISYII